MANMSKFSVTVVGLGYIGLPTAAILASRGHDVVGVDVSENVVNLVNSGKPHIEEADLLGMVQAAVNSGQLIAKTTPVASDVFIVAVPTPVLASRAPDVSYIKAAVLAICPVLRGSELIILESTSPVGTTRLIKSIVKNERPDLFKANEDTELSFAYCPERVIPGRILHELVYNDRVIGGIESIDAKRAIEFYSTFVKGVLVQSNDLTAEMVKLTENSYRDVNIAFANELSIICDELNIDVWELIRIANLHPRVDILSPGPGVGGHCIAIDPWFIVDRHGDNAQLIRAAREVNIKKESWVAGKISQAIKASAASKVKILGLTYKADTDDVRESPSINIIQYLASSHESTEFIVYDPWVTTLPKKLAGAKNIRQVGIMPNFLEHDLVVVLVAHKQFKHLFSANLICKVLDYTGIWLK